MCDHACGTALTSFEPPSSAHNNSGKHGLHSLGSACFMSSAGSAAFEQCNPTGRLLSGACAMLLGAAPCQCAAATVAKRLIRGNFLGTQGKLASACASLMKQMWLYAKPPLGPSLLCCPLMQLAPGFAGGQQRDSQELLAFFYWVAFMRA